MKQLKLKMSHSIYEGTFKESKEYYIVDKAVNVSTITGNTKEIKEGYGIPKSMVWSVEGL